MSRKIIISNKFALFLFVGAFIIFGLVSIKAFGGTNPSLLGHSGEEIHVTITGGSNPGIKTVNQALEEDLEFIAGTLDCQQGSRTFGSQGYPVPYNVNPGQVDCTDIPGISGGGIGYTVVAASCVDTTDFNYGSGGAAQTGKWDKPIDNGGTIEWGCEVNEIAGDFQYSIRAMCCK